MNLWINTAPGPRAFDWLAGHKPDPTHFPGHWEDADEIVRERDALRSQLAARPRPLADYARFADGSTLEDRLVSVPPSRVLGKGEVAMDRVKLAQAMCRGLGSDPLSREPGNRPKEDGRTNGVPWHYRWRDFLEKADKEIDALRAGKNGPT